MLKLKEWYFALDSNEQRMVLLGSAIFALVLLIFAVLKPLSNSVSSMELKVKSRQSSVDNWKAALPVILANRGNANSNSSGQPMNNIVSNTTRQFQLRLSRVEEKSNDEMHVWFDNIPFNDFVRWVAEIENRHQIKVDSVNIRSKDRDGLSSIDIRILRG